MAVDPTPDENLDEWAEPPVDGEENASSLDFGAYGGAGDDKPRQAALRGPLAIAGAVLVFAVIGAYFYFSDVNSDRWEIHCEDDQAEPRRGRYFPWWTKSIADDAHTPLRLPSGVSCARVELTSQEELDRQFGALLLEAAEHRLQQGGPEALVHARQDIERASRLQGLTAEQRSRTEALLADMSYHEAREILRQVERSLWQARRRLERARTLGAGERLGDLDEWLQFVQTETERFRPAMGTRGSEGEPDQPQQPDAGPPAPPTPPPVPPVPEDVFL